MSENVITELRRLMDAADDAVAYNVAEKEGHLYVKRGNNECCVAKPQCPEWAQYLAALIVNAPKMLAVCEAAEKLRISADAKIREYPDGRRYISFDPHGVNLLDLMTAVGALLQPKKETT